MQTCMSRYFGEIDLGCEEKWFDAELDVNGQLVETSITFLGEVNTLDKDEIERIDRYVDELSSHELKIRQALLEDFAAEGESCDYVEAQLDEQDEDVIAELIAETSRNLSLSERLLEALKLLRIVFYPDTDDPMFAVFDYSIGEELTDALLAVKLGKDGGLSFAEES